MGTLTSALATGGPDGAVYRFPTGTRLLVSNGTFSDSFPLDGTEALLNLRLPVGTYGVGVSFPGSAQFERTLGETTTLVDAVSTDPQPLTVTITENTTVPLALHFDVRGLADITFQAGQLALSVSISRGGDASTAGSIITTGSYLSQSIVFTAASDAARAALNMAPMESHPFELRLAVTGPWTQGSNSMLCAPATPSMFATDTQSGFNRAIAELFGGQGAACITDAGAQDTLTVSLERVGGAPTDQQMFLPGTNYRFFLAMSGSVGDVYDGTTFQQSKLQSATSLTGGFLQHQIWDNTLNQEVVFSHGTLNASTRLAL